MQHVHTPGTTSPSLGLQILNIFYVNASLLISDDFNSIVQATKVVVFRRPIPLPKLALHSLSVSLNQNLMFYNCTKALDALLGQGLVETVWRCMREGYSERGSIDHGTVYQDAALWPCQCCGRPAKRTQATMRSSLAMASLCYDSDHLPLVVVVSSLVKVFWVATIWRKGL
jgi:hypothetical protein